MGKITKKIKQIQKSDEKTKFRWILGCSAATMAIVIGLWIGFTKGGLTTALPEVTTKPSFFRVMQAGMEHILLSLRQKTANTILYFKNKINKRNAFSIQIPESVSNTPALPTLDDATTSDSGEIGVIP